MKMKKGVILGMVGVLIGTAGAYATLNIDTTINNLYSYVKKLILTDDGTANGTKTIKLDGTNGRIDAKSVYADNLYKGGNAVATEDYVNTKASQTLSSAKSYTTSKLNQVLSSAKSYTDSKVSQTLSSAKSYTDNHVVDGAHIANGSITSDKLSSALRAHLASTSNAGGTWVTTCNASNNGKRRRSDLKKCTYINETTTIINPHNVVGTKSIQFRCDLNSHPDAPLAFAKWGGFISQNALKIGTVKLKPSDTLTSFKLVEGGNTYISWDNAFYNRPSEYGVKMRWTGIHCVWKGRGWK